MMPSFLFMIYVFLHLFHFFFFNDTATTEIYTLSLHDALPISGDLRGVQRLLRPPHRHPAGAHQRRRSEEHTSELQSRLHLVCRLLLEKKKNKKKSTRENITPTMDRRGPRSKARVATHTSIVK